MEFPSPHDRVLPDKIKLKKTPDNHIKDNIYNQVIGSLVGLAIGDALGASVEFRPQQYLVANPVKKMEGGGTWGLKAGQWTDDTSMALCLAASLITQKFFNPYDQMVRFKWWHRHGYLSSTGHCFDIGQATRESIKVFSNRQKILKTKYRCRTDDELDKLTWDSVKSTKDFNVYCGSEGSAGNGALMRLAPIPLFYFKTPKIAIEYAGSNTSLTHANKKAIDACRFYAALIVATLHDYTKDELLHEDFYSKHKQWFGEEPLHEEIKLIAEGSYKRKGGYEQGIRGKGYVVNALEAALWAFWSDNGSFERGALAAVNLGDDTDTTAAIYGQLAGAFYGYQNIPKEWIKKLYAHDLVVCIGEWLHFHGNQRSSEDGEFQHAASTTIPTDNTKSSEEKKQRSITIPVISQSDHSKTYETNDKYNNNNNNTSYVKQKSANNESSPIIEFNRSLSLNAVQNSPTTRISSFDIIPSEFSRANPHQTYNEHDDFTRKGHDHPFYRKKN